MATWKDIDLSFVENGDSTVINCRTKEGISALAQAICNRYPEYKGQLQDYVKFYQEYNDGNGMALRVRLVGKNRLSLGYCTAEWYKENYYKVIELSDITCKAKDLGDINTGHMNINAALAALF